MCIFISPPKLAFDSTFQKVLITQSVIYWVLGFLLGAPYHVVLLLVCCQPAMVQAWVGPIIDFLWMQQILLSKSCFWVMT